MRKRNSYLILTIFVTTALSLGACTRSASTDPDAAEPTVQDPVESIFNVGGTLTAEAAAAGGGIILGPDEGIGGGDGETGEGEGLIAVLPSATPQLATATPAPPAVPTSSGMPSTYTLHKGEFPYCLARRFNVDVNALLSANGLGQGGLYLVGQVLTIPQGAGPYQGQRALSPHPTQYTVVSDDSIYGIACKFGNVYPEDIASANGISVGAALTVGQTLQIP